MSFLSIIVIGEYEYMVNFSVVFVFIILFAGLSLFFTSFNFDKILIMSSMMLVCSWVYHMYDDANDD